jgi:2-polyprenyl-6-methoxyphenol hydroxylase-like FAD-dependent oxidoreductase
MGLSWEHADLVERIRDRTIAEPGVRYMPGARVRLEAPKGPEGELLAHVVQEGRSFTPSPDRIVDATGKAGLGRRALQITQASGPASVSRMCGLELLDVEAPVPGYGHVFLGGPGPMLLYRIRPNSLRVVVDIPHWFDRGGKPEAQALCDAWGPALSPQLRPAFERAAHDSKAKWVNVAVRVRQSYGKGRLALIGDAVGHYHPLTAAGMTNAVLDARVLAQNERLEDYARERTRTSKSAGLLGVALYDMFASPEPEVDRMRASLFDRWRNDEKERRRTMGYLGMGDQRVTAFMSSYLKVVSGGLRTPGPGGRLDALRQSATFLGARAPWLLRSFGASSAAGPCMVPRNDNVATA